MQFFNNLRVKYKIVLILSTIVALFVVGLVYMLTRINAINESVEAMYETNLMSVDYLIEADRDAYQSSIALSQMLNRQNDAKLDSDLIADVKDNLGQVKQRFEKAEKLWAATGEKKTTDFAVFHSNYELWSKHSATMLSQLKARQFEQAGALYFGDYAERFSEVRTAMDNLTGVFLNGAETKYQSSIAESKNIYTSAIVTLVICIGFSILFGFVLTRGIIIPIQQSNRLAEKMSAGDLTVQSSLRSKDELGVMSQTLSKMVRKLNATIGDVQQVASQVSSGADQLTAASSQISSGAVEQAASAEEVSAAMEEMSASIQQNAANAQRTETIAVKVAKDAAISGQSVLRAVEAMQKISKKITIIEEIARQTNMLSLNASIEAARAGEHGKGFAVVASAVGKLAARSQEAAGDISALSIETVAVADNARNMLSQLVPEIQQTTELIQEISAASSEQSHGAEQINVAIRGLDEVIQQNSAAAEQTASTAEELSEQSKHLLANIGFFKVDDKKDAGRTNHLYHELKNTEETEDAFITQESITDSKNEKEGLELADF